MLHFDGGEVLGTDAMLEFDIVIETVFDRRPGGELGIRPKTEDGGGHDMSTGMAHPLQVGHAVTLIQSFPLRLFAVSLHKRKWEEWPLDPQWAKP